MFLAYTWKYFCCVSRNETSFCDEFKSIFHLKIFWFFHLSERQGKGEVPSPKTGLGQDKARSLELKTRLPRGGRDPSPRVSISRKLHSEQLVLKPRNSDMGCGHHNQYLDLCAKCLPPQSTSWNAVFFKAPSSTLPSWSKNIYNLGGTDFYTWGVFKKFVESVHFDMHWKIILKWTFLFNFPAIL